MRNKNIAKFAIKSNSKKEAGKPFIFCFVSAKDGFILLEKNDAFRFPTFLAGQDSDAMAALEKEKLYTDYGEVSIIDYLGMDDDNDNIFLYFIATIDNETSGFLCEIKKGDIFSKKIKYFIDKTEVITRNDGLVTIKDTKDLMDAILAYRNIDRSEIFFKYKFFDLLTKKNCNQFSRNHFDDGHITASCILFNKDRTKILLTKHSHLGIWLQPGGHSEEHDATPLHTALREASEESGIPMDQISFITDEIFHIDVHEFPGNIKKNEPPHLHYDIMFIMETRSDEISISNESEELRWIDKSMTSDALPMSNIIKPIDKAIYLLGNSF